MPPDPQDGHKRPYIAKQGLSRSWGRLETVTSKALLPLVERIHCPLRRQNRVEIVALPLHSAFVEIVAVLHRDEPRIQKDADIFHHGVLGHACLGGDSVVAGMAGVRPAILNQKEIGIDHKRRGRKAQQKNLVWQSEKLSAVSTPMAIQVCLQR